jgi:hypothetical protein
MAGSRKPDEAAPGEGSRQPGAGGSGNDAVGLAHQDAGRYGDVTEASRQSRELVHQRTLLDQKAVPHVSLAPGTGKSDHGIVRGAEQTGRQQLPDQSERKDLTGQVERRRRQRPER